MIKVAVLEADEVAKEYMRRLVDTGTYGKTADEVASNLVQEGLAAAVHHGIIKFSIADPDPAA